MKTPVLFRIVILVLALASPLLSSANELKAPAEGPGAAFVADSIPRRQQPAKPEDKKPEDRKPEDRKPDIKEVPRSRHLPKPTAVIDRIKNKRPPVRIPRPVGGGRGRVRLP